MKVLHFAALKEKGICLSRVQVWRLVKRGRFPRPIKVTAGRNGWIESEIETYLKDRIAERDAQVRRAA